MKVRAHRLSVSYCLGLCALSLLFFSVLPGPARGQQVSRSFGQGTHLFRRLLYDLHLQPLRSIGELYEEQENKLLIILGETDYLLPLINLKDFVEQGGAVLLATDRNCQNLIQPFGVQVMGDLVITTEAKFAYKEAADCVFVQPAGKNVPLFENLSVTDNPSRVVTNRPGYLAPAPNCKLPLLATFPRGCWALDPVIVLARIPVGRREWLLRERYQNRILPFAVGGEWGPGRILILSDHSVFINAMMWQPDIENFDFTYNCVNWLTEGGRRTQVLFLEEGQVQKTFQIPLKEPPLPPLPPLKAIVETMDKGLGDLERENAFNQAIHQAVTSITGPGEKWVQAVVLMSTAMLALFGLARLSQSRYRPEKIPLPAGSDLGRMPAAASLFEQRRQAMLRERNLWESARALAQQGLESALGPQLRANSPPSMDAALPLELGERGGSWWRRWRLRRRFNRLWQLAYGAEPVRVSPRQLRRLHREIEQMKTAFARSSPATDAQVTQPRRNLGI
jgi:hypothetical protein